MIPEVLGRLIGYHRYGRGGYFSEQLKDKYENLAAYFNLCSLSALRSSVSSRRQICCCDDLTFGCSPGAFVRCFGKPQHRIKGPNELTDLLLVYRQQWHSYKVKSELHFARQGLFYFNRTFPHLSQAQKQQLLLVLADKYHDGEPVDFTTEKLVDPVGNEIIVSQNLVLSIDYLARQGSSCVELVETIRRSQLIKQRQADRQLSKLYHHL
ncbi:hypothetical protein [Thiocapsa marina]|uniref:Uncharacterized protein n=1 Tax=Thiocapsa marina 5811 TaxID=768671 RepID=F9UCP5_9GAMM|nr:hypothetical protein [Thiocapsa marina]EGV18158.1 hypothetical protein ThimaDRAFT_2697 [Thiocapsa marina 5811]